MIISRNNKPKFKLQTAYDTLTSRLRGLGYDVDGNIELDTSGYGHGWIKVLRNGRKNNFIYMCSHSDNVDPLCCEPVYRYIKVYNYCDDPKDSNLLGDIPYVVSNISEIPDATEVYKDDQYKVYKDIASDIVWGYMNLGDGHVAQAPWTEYPTTLKDLSGGNIETTVPYFDIIDNKGIKFENGSYSAFDNLFEDDDTLYLGKSKVEKQLYTWNSAISGTVESNSLYDTIDHTVCPYCFGTTSDCPYCDIVDDVKLSQLYFNPGPGPTHGYNRGYIYLTSAANCEVVYDNETLIDGNNVALFQKDIINSDPEYSIDHQLSIEKLYDTTYRINYCIHKQGEQTGSFMIPGPTPIWFNWRKAYIKRSIIKSLSETDFTEISDTFTYNNLAQITVKFKLPPLNTKIEALELPAFLWNPQSSHPSYVSLSNTISNTYLHAYMKDHKDTNGVYENINVHVNDRTNSTSEILNYMLHSKVKTFEYSPFDYWNYDEIMNFILYKDENLQVLPTRNGVYHLKTNYYNELKNNSEIAELENVLDYNTCMHLGYLGDNEIHTDYYATTDKNTDVSYLQAYPYLKDPFKFRYNYFPNNEVHNIKFLKTPDNGFFEGIFQYHNDQLDALPNKYVWLTMNYNKLNAEQPYYNYEGNIDTAEIRKPYTDKKWEWQNNFHNFLTQREIKGIYYKESFSACDTLSAISGLRFDTSPTPGGSENIPEPTTSQWTQAVDISNDFFTKDSNGYYVKGDGTKTCYDTFNNVSWNGLSAYRHVCRTCSGIGMINPYKLGCDRWYYNNYVPSNFKNFIEHSACCPTCARTGVQTRYLYYKHKYVKPLANYGYTIDDVNDDRVTFGNQILLPDNLIDDDLKKDLIIYATSADPVEYYEAKLANANTGNDITYKLSYLGYNQMYSYADVSRDANDEPEFIKHWTDIPNWNKMTNDEKETTKKQWTKRLYRVINPPDKFVQYYAFKGHDNAKEKDAWSRLFFDNKWIEKQYFENNTLENPNQYVMNKEIINKGDHNHNHVSEITHDLTDDRGYPYYGTNSQNNHYRRYELDYRKNGVLLQHTCPVCNGEGTIQTFKTDDQGEIIYDITGKAVMIDVPCPTCNGNGYLEDTHREDYNTAKCSTCNNEGHITCPKCLGTGVSYAAKDGYTLERVSTVSTDEVMGAELPYKILERHFMNGTTEMIQFFRYVEYSRRPTGITYKPEPFKTITAGTAIDEEDNDYVYSIACPNCSRYTDLDNGQIPCPECGGTFKQGDDYYRIAPGNEDTKKVYKYISINAVSIDNISIEMDNGI